MPRGPLPLLALIAAFWPAGRALAACPATETILGELTCSSTVTGQVGYLESSDLGGLCAAGECYTCGSPYAPLAQREPEDVYSFTCQRSGSVTLEISGLDCDLDIYILDSTCDPNSGCESGSTQASWTTDTVTFTCAAGDTYYVVIEGYGFDSAVSGSGACRGGSDGDYTLSFDVSAGTGCSEDCDNGVDDDFDGDVDCDDSDCADDPLCNCDEDGDGYDGSTCGGSDCDDTDASVHPGATESCDGVDEDCDGTVDDGAVDASIYYQDYDRDGYGNPDVSQRACSTPSGYVSNDDDCYDRDSSASPVGTESADGIDDDCDGTVDEGTEAYDDDGDGYSERGGDCDDASTAASPAAVETCNGVDDDCDGTADDQTDCYDDDGDGYTENDGDCNDADDAVSPSDPEVDGNEIDDDCDGVVDSGEYDPDRDGYTASAGDCDETDGDVHPGAEESPDGEDEDCDGVIDEGTTAYDDDRDGQTEAGGDCNDADATVYAGAEDVENGVDDDCDGLVDEGSPAADDDGDGLSENGGDCDDADEDVSPAAEEDPTNGVDDDCDGEVDEVDLDGDGDGYTPDDGDCNDTDGWVAPGRAEACNGLDDNCDGSVDEGCTDALVDGGAKQDACGCATGSAGLALFPMLAALGLAAGLRRRNA